MALRASDPRSIENFVREPKTWPDRLAEYTVATLPGAARWKAGLIAVTDETGGYTVAISDGTDWLRLQDRAVVS